jgi:hypothetical protein
MLGVISMDPPLSLGHWLLAALTVAAGAVCCSSDWQPALRSCAAYAVSTRSLLTREGPGRSAAGYAADVGVHLRISDCLI